MVLKATGDGWDGWMHFTDPQKGEILCHSSMGGIKQFKKYTISNICKNKKAIRNFK